MKLRLYIPCPAISYTKYEGSSVKLWCCQADGIYCLIKFTKFVTSSTKSLVQLIFNDFDCLKLNRIGLYDPINSAPLKKQVVLENIQTPLQETQNINMNQSQNVQRNTIQCDTLSNESFQKFPINVSEILTEKSSQKVNRIEKQMDEVQRQMKTLKAEQDQIKREGVSKIEKNGGLAKSQQQSLGQRILQTVTKFKIAIERMKQLRKQLEEVIEDEEEENDQNQRNSTQCSISEQQNDYQQI